MSRGFLVTLVLLATIPVTLAQSRPVWREWNSPIEPFQVIDNIYYVGAKGIAAYLITGSEGHVLIDGGFTETAPLIRKNVAALGFELSDIKILLNTHAHFDHCGGLAELAKATGARVVISAGDADVIESGGKTDFYLGDDEDAHFAPLAVDRRIRDREQVKLGDVELTAHVTAGHTRGCTSWATKVTDDERSLDVVLVCSSSVLDYRLVDQPSYPGISDDFEASFERLRSLPCDVFLAPHASFFKMSDKLKIRAAGTGTNPFIDPEGYRAYVDKAERKYRKALEAQRAELAP